MKTEELIDEILDEAEYRRTKRKLCDEFLWHDSEVRWMLKMALNKKKELKE